MKLPVYTSGLITPIFLPISSPCLCPQLPPTPSLSRYFHSRTCWVTIGSTSSQTVWIKISREIRCIFQCSTPSIHHAIFSPPLTLSCHFLSGGDLFSIFVHLQSPGLTLANCAYSTALCDMKDNGRDGAAAVNARLPCPPSAFVPSESRKKKYMYTLQGMDCPFSLSKNKMKR